MFPKIKARTALWRALALFAVAATLAACGLVEGDGRATQPLSSSIVAKLKAMGSSPGEAMIVRIIKQDSTLEVWKQVTGTNSYKLFKTYEICAWSGDLGPKIKEGDRQSPEGFYSISPGLMNPKSNYYLAFNTGYPNKFDRAWGRTGSQLMVHGDCSSRGCYAMTDEQIAEIYALGREAFLGGQRSFQLMIFPFRMTVANMVKYRNNPNIGFWWQLKKGWDTFELSHTRVQWDVCDKHYVFYPQGSPLNATGACPSGSSAPALMARVDKKQATDRAAFKIAAVTADKTDAKKLAEAEAAARAKTASEQALQQRTAAVNNGISGFFSSIFGGGNPAPQSTPADGDGTLDPNLIAPIPAPPPNR